MRLLLLGELVLVLVYRLKVVVVMREYDSVTHTTMIETP